MIIILPGANASANNIGQVDVPFTWDADALAYKDAIPVAAATFTTNKNRALNTFVKGLKSASLWSKISHVVVPLFGSSEGGVNVKSPAQNINFPASGSVVTYNANGATFLLGWDSLISVNKQEVTMGWYNTQSGTGASAIGPGSHLFGRASNGGETAYTINPTKRPTVLNHTASIGGVIGVINVSGGQAFINADGEASAIVAITATDVPAGTATLKMGAATAGLATNRSTFPFGMFVVGSVMTPAEIALFNEIIRNFMVAMTAA